ncbi:hypothetical protein GCM10025857_09400 [Alicyclobacillus contaminans]|uniref:DUF2239 family protein n=1 Tax=Alicyclobacillus contaminans TaxID=392016 RepID=UPI000557964B|nr:DUF2239 family protein [Alicyclobacillus contaminans]GMA49583.1 hypothetical protein GCM10025857_09400 [Alicyclobacillus contaminans]
MNRFMDTPCTAFLGEHVVASGPLAQVVSKVKDTINHHHLSQVLIFDDSTSRQIEIDFRGTKEAVLERLSQHPDAVASIPQSDTDSLRRVGRPRLGVVAGEVTLLPRHWEWLKSQPGGASATLRRLIDEARHARENQDKVRAAQEATYRFMTVMAGNLSHYEEALRALFAGDSRRFYELIDGWASDIRNHIKKLAAHAFPNNGADDSSSTK